MTRIIPGPGPLSYKCPFCGNYYESSRILSAYISYSTVYTDGYVDGDPYYWNYWFTTCPKCKKIFNKKYLIEVKLTSKEDYILQMSKEAKFFGKIDDRVNGEFDYLDYKVWENTIKIGLSYPNNSTQKDKFEDKKGLYIGLWQSYNRLSESDRENVYDKYYECCHKLIELLSKSFTPKKRNKCIEDCLMLAEIYRNLGDFSMCEKIIKALIKIEPQDRIHFLTIAIIYGNCKEHKTEIATVT